MLYSTRYFQLTSDILVEYNYTKLDVADSQEGDEGNYMYDLLPNSDGEGYTSHIVDNGYNSSRNFLLDDYLEGYVLPINSSDSTFIQCYNGTATFWDAQSITGNIRSNDLVVDENTSDILKDNFKLHFTSRNYLGDYDGFILKIMVYDEMKNKISLFSHYIKKTDDLNINSDPMLINQKLYTTYLSFSIPSVNGLMNVAESRLAGESYIRKKLLVYGDYDFMENTPIIFSIYGVKSTYKYLTFECYRTELLNTIYLPNADSYDNLSIHIDEADDGDYFEIYPVVGDGSTSFSDYITEISNGDPTTYIILHEITLTENYTDHLNHTQSELTHREHFILNAATSLEDGTIEINEDDIDRIMTYRPVIQHSGKITSFVIEDQMKILNTVDNTTTVKLGSYQCSVNPKKYGKNMEKIYLGDSPAQIKVYNKRADETDSIKLTNGGSNVTIENHQHSIIGFIECANVGVTVEQIPASYLNE